VALYLAPIWTARYLPTTDGPSHVFNAWALDQLAGRSSGGAAGPGGDAAGASSLLARYLEINPQPVPNYLTHVALAALMRALAPAAAEKVLVSGCVLLMAGALWYLAGAVERERAWLALLGLPFVWTTLLQLGFYNFCLGMALFLLALGLWWRHRLRPGLGFAVALDALLVLCYFAHILPAVLALVGIGVLWAASLRRERWRGHLAHLVILAPAMVLPAWFTLIRQGSPGYPSYASWQSLWVDLAHLRPLWAFVEEGGWTGMILAATFGGWIAFTLVRERVGRRREAPGGGEAGRGERGAGGASAAGGPWSRRALRWLREEDGFAVLALLAAGLYFASPEGAAGGSMLKPRLLLVPFLAVLPWLSARLGRWGRAAAVLALAALAARPALYALPCYRAGGRDVESFVRGLDAVPAGSVVVPLIFDHHTTSCLWTGTVDHATGYAAVARGFLDYDNYEASTDYFPLRYRAWVRAHGDLAIESDPLHLDVRRLQSRVDYVYCWRMPLDSQVAGRLERRCRLVAAGDGWRLYSTEERERAAAGDPSEGPPSRRLGQGPPIAAPSGVDRVGLR
jgi:hypothetical protein